jgi:tetracycline 7-halogenase / FADH2 O2-dependent halogenase
MATTRLDVDVAVVGAGFAGSLTAMALRACGRSVALLERGRHPRFAIGESSTPLANLLLEQLCSAYALDAVQPLTKWGTWQAHRPDVACGLKRGFSFMHHTPHRPFEDDEWRTRQLLVAASPHDGIADSHWYRPDVDTFLAEQACLAGAVYLDQTSVTAVHEQANGMRLTGERHGARVDAHARFVIDASGPHGALHRLMGLQPTPLRWLPPTQSLYTHFAGVREWRNVSPAHAGPDLPHPVDAAALHHVLPGGWIWVLRFNNGITSAGAALTDTLAEEIGMADGADAWQRLLDRLPSVRHQFALARPLMPFVHVPRLARRTAQVAGERWALLPSAAGVIDPLLSTGFPLTLLGVQRLVGALVAHWEQPTLRHALRDYADATTRQLDATEQLVGALYAAMDDPELFNRLARLYFAAASFSETARRLGREDLARGFLLCDDERFGPMLRACTDAARARPSGSSRAELLADIDTAIEPFDVAGLRDDTRRNWHPVLAEDLLAARAKLGASDDEIQALLERCGFARTVVHA